MVKFESRSKLIKVFMCDNRYLMKRMKNLISIVFLTVWLLNAVQALAAGVCGSGQCCCTKNTVSVQISVKALAPCGQQECALSVNKDTQKEDMALPFLLKTSEVNSGALALAPLTLEGISFLKSFDLASLHLRPPLVSSLYIQYHQFLI